MRCLLFSSPRYVVLLIVLKSVKVFQSSSHRKPRLMELLSGIIANTSLKFVVSDLRSLSYAQYFNCKLSCKAAFCGVPF
jgi:hypothetical protein